MKKFIPILLIFSLFVITCKKGRVEDTPQIIGDVVIPKEVKVIDSQTWNKNYISIDSVSKTITFSKDISSSQPMKTGDIVVSSAGEGLLRKVKSISTVGNSITVQTESATLTDAIQKGLIEFKQPLNVSQIKSIKYFYGGIKLNKGNIGDLKAGAQNWEINTVLYDNDGNPSTTYDQIKLVGTFNCDWQLVGRIDIGLLEGLKEVKFGFESSENLDLQLIAGLQYNFEKSYKLATVYFTSFVVQVGIVPVVFTPQLDIYAGIEGYANGSVTTGISQNISFNTGMQYLKNQGWSPFTSLNKSLTFQPPTLNVNAGASAYIKPELTVKVYSVVGPYANLKLYERLDANILETPWWKLNAGIKMNAGVKVDILDKFLLECTISDLLNYEVMLSQSTSPPISKPSVTTTNITSYTSSSATVGGNVVTDGGAAITERGVYWSTSQNPETTGTKLQIGNGTGSFSSNLTGLNPNTQYYVKAYATNSAGTSYGSQVTFTTSVQTQLATLTTAAATSVTATSAISGGNITSDGGASVTSRGVCWSTSSNPTTSSSKTSDGTGAGTFTSSLTGLTPNITYYVRAYAINSVGTAYGSQTSFATSAPQLQIASLTTTAASAITTSSATSGGIISSDGGASVTARGVCWSTSQNPTTGNIKTTNGTGTGSFTSSITGLSPNTTYYVRAYAINSVGTAYGSQLSFKTSVQLQLPTLTTTAATSITTSTATSGGNVTSDGGATVTTRGVCWSTSSTPTTSNAKTSNGSGTGTFSSSITGLSPNTTYYVRAYATNSVNTAYGSQRTFTTAASNLPTGRITGIVRDASTSASLSSVTITVFKSTTTTATSSSQSDGRYDISIPGNTGYKVVFSKQGYLNAEYQNVNVTVGGNTVLEPVLQIDQTYSGNGDISGTIKNALDGTGIPSVSLKLRSGINVTSGTIIQSTTTSSSGTYTFSGVPAGNYTIEASKSNFNTAYFSAICLGGRTVANQGATMSPILITGVTRIVLTWGQSPFDLDSHLTGPLADGTRFHMWYQYAEAEDGSPWPETVTLDLDDVSSYGPETTTLLRQINGIYRFSVHDYSNKGLTNSNALSNSGAQVKVYKNSGLVATFNIPPSTGGTLWTVFEMSGSTITTINRMEYESTPFKGGSINTEIQLFRNLPQK